MPPRKKLPETRSTSPEELYVDGEKQVLSAIRPSTKKSKIQPRTSNLTRKYN
jgi:hypothetical protein